MLLDKSKIQAHDYVVFEQYASDVQAQQVMF